MQVTQQIQGPVGWKRVPVTLDANGAGRALVSGPTPRRVTGIRIQSDDLTTADSGYVRFLSDMNSASSFVPSPDNPVEIPVTCNGDTTALHWDVNSAAFGVDLVGFAGNANDTVNVFLEREWPGVC